MIVREGHPSLKAVCGPFDFERHDAARLRDQLVQAMFSERGAGCAAPQIGVELRAFVLETISEPIACFNPEILEGLDGLERGSEGCLSYPGVFVFVRRHRRVRVKYQDRGGRWIHREFTGQQARAFQHELDHLDGRTLPDLVPAQAWTLAKAKVRRAA